MSVLILSENVLQNAHMTSAGLVQQVTPIFKAAQTFLPENLEGISSLTREFK
jgi:hypothetical protein